MPGHVAHHRAGGCAIADRPPILLRSVVSRRGAAIDIVEQESAAGRRRRQLAEILDARRVTILSSPDRLGSQRPFHSGFLLVRKLSTPSARSSLP